MSGRPGLHYGSQCGPSFSIATLEFAPVGLGSTATARSMKVSVPFVFLAAAVASVHADSFSAEDQAIWIDRHNYFRTTGLPWSAGDMRRIGWSSDLATTAASTAAACSATTAAGVNVFQSTSSNSSSVIDEAIQSWVVETSMTTLKTLPQPGAVGVDVGTGVYNSYSQVLWDSTTSVGCATASCSGGDLVVCNYSPAGNDGSSPWFVHGNTASDCPSGTTASLGLCIVEGDSANDQIAAIPAGKLTYEVYPAYVPDMQTVLIEAARAIASGSPTNSTGSTTTATTAPSATTAAPTATTAPPTAPTTSSGSSDTKTSSTKQTATSSSGSSSDSTGTKSSKTTTSSGSSSESSSATKTGKTTTSSDSSSGSSTPTKKGKTTTSSSSTDSSSDSATKQTSDESSPGTVKASSDSGSAFTNQASTTTGSSTAQSSGSATTASAPSTASTESTTASSGTATSISNKTSTEGSGGISAAGMAGMIVLAIVGVAAFGVVMSYKRNQQRQREIMRDGGIRII
ncbi:hypothetical protein PRIC1_004630 [Phytophthora ramorum]